MESLLAISIEVAGCSTPVRIAISRADPVGQQLPLGQPGGGDILRQQNGRRPELACLWIAVDPEWIVAPADKSAALAGNFVDGGVLDDFRQRCERRDSGSIL